MGDDSHHEEEVGIYKNFVEQSLSALERMPAFKKGLVVGAGGNAKAWEQRGWETLDNQWFMNQSMHKFGIQEMPKRMASRTYDFVLSDGVQFKFPDEKMAFHMITAEDLFIYCNPVLKIGGVLMVSTAEITDQQTPIPTREGFMQIANKCGYEFIPKELVVNNPVRGGVWHDRPDKSNEITYFCQKVHEL